MLTFFLLACDRAPDPPPVPERFSCEVAAAWLGHPQSRVVACDPVSGLPELVEVALEGPDIPGGRLSTTLRFEGETRRTEVGGPAMAAWLAALPPERVAELDLPRMMAVLRAFQAFPPGFDGRSAGFAMPAIGTSSFSPAPFRLVLYTGLAPEERFLRATLVGREVPWAWTMEERAADGSWAVVGGEALSAEPAE